MQMLFFVSGCIYMQIICVGLFFIDGPVWQANRRFSLRHLRDFGYGRRFAQYEADLEMELLDFVQMIRDKQSAYAHEQAFKRNDGTMLCPQMFFACTGNALLKVLFRETCPRAEQHRLIRFVCAGQNNIFIYNFPFSLAQHSYTFTTKGDSYGRMFSLIPWLSKYFGDRSDFNAIREASIDLHGLVKEMIVQQWNTYDPTIERHFLDIYFKEIKATENDGKESSYTSRLCHFP